MSIQEAGERERNSTTNARSKHGGLSLASQLFTIAWISFENEMKGRTHMEMVGVSGWRRETCCQSPFETLNMRRLRNRYDVPGPAPARFGRAGRMWHEKATELRRTYGRSSLAAEPRGKGFCLRKLYVRLLRMGAPCHR